LLAPVTMPYVFYGTRGKEADMPVVNVPSRNPQQGRSDDLLKPGIGLACLRSPGTLEKKILQPAGYSICKITCGVVTGDTAATIAGQQLSVNLAELHLVLVLAATGKARLSNRLGW
jgi:hypothetical protein